MTKVTTLDRSALAGLLAGGLVGFIVALQALDPQFIAGTGGLWVRPENDYNAYLVAWNYYVVDSWRLPLFSVPSMGYPEGGNVLFNDALPLTALPTKILYRLSGTLINPFGWWVFLTYVLQGVMAARLLQSAGVRSIWGATAAAALAVVSTSFVTRMGHTALSTEALVLWALALHFSSLRHGRARPVESTILLTITLLVNAYLFVMVFVLVAATLVALRLRQQLDTHDLRHAALGIAIVVAVGLLAGYGFVFANPTAMTSNGFGRFSWNLPTLFLPPEGVFGVLQGITRDATHGQYEGEAYIGRGALLLLVLAALWAPGRVLGYVRQYWVLCCALAALAIFAASNRVYAGGTLLVAYDLPRVVIGLANCFRASGRFIWPLAYWLTLLPLACRFRWWRPLPAIVAASLAVWLQVSEAMPGIRYRRVLSTQAHADLIDEPRTGRWISDHQRVWQFPSWDCGGLVGGNRKWPSVDANRELQLQLAAARAHTPMNSVYMSRSLKNCAAEAAWGTNPQLEDGTLYVLGPSTVHSSPTLSALATSNACVTLDWAVVCSSSWARTESH